MPRTESAAIDESPRPRIRDSTDRWVSVFLQTASNKLHGRVRLHENENSIFDALYDSSPALEIFNAEVDGAMVDEIVMIHKSAIEVVVEEDGKKSKAVFWRAR